MMFFRMRRMPAAQSGPSDPVVDPGHASARAAGKAASVTERYRGLRR